MKDGGSINKRLEGKALQWYENVKLMPDYRWPKNWYNVPKGKKRRAFPELGRLTQKQQWLKEA